MNTNGNERNKWFQSHSRKARIFSNSVEQSSNCTLRPVQQQGRPINLAANSSFPDLTNCSVLLHPFAQAVGLYWFCKSTSKQEAGANFAVLWCCSRARRRGLKPTAGSVRQDVREDHRDAALLRNRQRSNDVCKSCSGTLIALMTPCVWLLRTSSRRWGLIYFSPHVAINDTLPFFFFCWGTISPLSPPSLSLPDAQSRCRQLCCRTFLIDSSPRLTCCVHICKLLLILFPLLPPESASAHHLPIRQPLQMLKIRLLHIIELVWKLEPAVHIK